MAPPNITLQAPVAYYGTTVSGVDGTQYVVGPTGLVVVPGGPTVAALIANYGFTMPAASTGEPVNAGVTAKAGGGQAGATALLLGVNSVDTVVTDTDSVMLPASGIGHIVWILNTTSKGIQVFGVGADTINGVAATTGVYQPPMSLDMYLSKAAGVWQVETGFGISGSLPTDTAQDGLTAHAGGGQALALPLVREMNRLTVVATVGDSVALPPSAAGMGILVLNHGAQAAQVFGAGTDTINDVATATGVSQMASSLALYFCFTAGAWYSADLNSGYFGSFATVTGANAITARAGGGQALATPLTVIVNRVSVCATAGDSVLLPATAGFPAGSAIQLVVINDGAQSCNVFPNGADTINTLAASTAFAIPAGQVVAFTLTVAGAWQTSPSQFTLPSKYTLNGGAGPLTAAAGDMTGAIEVVVEYNALGANNLTTSTAAQLIADSGFKQGQAYLLAIENTSLAGDGTLVAGAGVTITGNATLPRNTRRTFVVTITGAATVTVQSVAYPDADIIQRQASKYGSVAAAGPYTALAGEHTGAEDIIAEYTNISGSTLTTRIGAQIVGDGPYKIGASWRLRIKNSSAGTLTLTAGDGNVTLTGKVAITTNTYCDYNVRVTGANTVVFTYVGTGTV